MKASVFSLGCKVNQCEGQSMIAALQSHGIDATDVLEYADFYIINTCSVTAEADRKSRQTVARVHKLNPDAKVYICGCSSQNNPDAFSDKKNVRLIVGTASKTEWIERILADLHSDAEQSVAACQVTVPPSVYENAPQPQHTKTRSYIKIQDGCNNFCTYCIIPYLRGRSRSRSVDSILQEATAAAQVTQEIVITGINASAYGSDVGESLCSLVRAMAQIPVRKRIGSLECTVIDDALLEAMAQSGFCDHFHLSLQSGSASVLKRMNRHYTPEFYLQKVEQIRKVFPSAGITTDIITGFCGESETEAQETRDFVRAVRFSDMHVFPYSERKGTKACAMPQIEKHIRQERALQLIAIGEELHTEFCARQLGSVQEVYAETQENGMSVGYTSNYVKVYSDLPVGTLHKVKLQNLYKQGVKGGTI